MKVVCDALVVHLPDVVAVRVLQAIPASVLRTQQLVLHNLHAILVQDVEQDARVGDRVPASAQQHKASDYHTRQWGSWELPHLTQHSPTQGDDGEWQQRFPDTSLHVAVFEHDL